MSATPVIERGSLSQLAHNWDDAGEDTRMGRIVLRGTLIGYLVIGTLVSGLALIGGAGMPASLWIGGFCAFWAGPGWGGMLALTVAASGPSKSRRGR